MIPQKRPHHNSNTMTQDPTKYKESECDVLIV